MAIQDFGKKIGGARKDLWRERGLRIEDIGDFNLAERAKYINKNNAWPKPDYAKMMNEEGYSRDALYFIKNVRDSIPTSPILEYGDSEETIARKQEAYLNFINEIKEELLKIKTNQDIGELGISYFADKGYVSQRNPYSSYQIEYAGSAFINNKLFKAVQMNAAQANRDATRKGFLVDNLGAIKERFSIIEVDGSLSNENAWWNKGGTAIKRDRYGGTDYFYPINDTVGEYIKGMNLELYRGNFFIMRDNYILGITHDYQEAQQFVEQQAQDMFNKNEQEKAAAKEANKADPKRKRGLVPPILAHIERKGPEMRTGNVTGEDFIKTFNIKGGEFGNWLNENERQTNMNMAFDSFKDIAKALGINDADIAMGNRLNIAFGSRGRKGAAAHYEPLREVINLTKMKGAGSLAHELFHAMDDISGKAMGLKSFATEHPRANSAFTDLVNALRYKEVTLSPEEQNKENLERANKLADKLRQDIVRMVPDRILSPEQIEERDKILKDLFEKVQNADVQFRETQFGRTGKIKFKIHEDEIKDICNFIDTHSKSYQMNAHNKEWLACHLSNVQAVYVTDRATEPITKKVETDFYKDSKKMDDAWSKSTHGYWKSSAEMAARAFACYLHDKMNEIGIKNDYLTGHAFQKGIDADGNIIPVYPKPLERVEMNKAFDKVIEQMKELGIFHEREENHLAVETEHCYIAAERNDKFVHFTVMDKDFNEIASANMMHEVALTDAIKNAVSLNDRGSEIKEMDYSVFEAKMKQRQRDLSMDIPTIDPNSYKQMTFEDLIKQTINEQKSREDNKSLQEKPSDVKALKDARQKLFDEQREILNEKKRIREEFHLPILGFSATEQGKQFEAQYGARLQEIQKAIEELNVPIHEFEDGEKEKKRRQSETLEEKQARKKELIEQRVSISREESTLEREKRDIRFEWSQTMDRVLDELDAQGRPTEDLYTTKEWEEHKTKLDAIESKLQEFKEEYGETLDKLNTEIDLLTTEIDAYLNNEEYVKYHKALTASGLSEADFRRQQIIEAHGLAKAPHLAGYIFPDGTMLKMGEEGYRGDDHRLVRAFFEPGSKEFNNAETSMWAFIAEGNIRWMPEGPGISIDANCPMTRDQKMALYDIIDYAKNKSESFYMDVVNGNNIKSFKYEGKQMSVAKIAKDFNDCRAEMLHIEQKHHHNKDGNER